MTIPQSIPVVVGALALFSTSALVALHAIIACDVEASASSTTHNAALAAAILESGGLLVIVAHFVTFHLRKRIYQTVPQHSHSEKQPQRTRPSTNVWFGLSVIFCTAAAAASVTALACLQKATPSLPQAVFGSGATGFLAGAFVTLTVCYCAQLLFLAAQFTVVRMLPSHDAPAESPHAADSTPSVRPRKKPAPLPHIPSIPYHETGPPPLRVRTDKTSSSTLHVARAPLSPPGSSGGHSAAETMNSLRLSLSNAIRPISSRTRLLPAGSSSSQRSSRYSGSHSATHSICMTHPSSPTRNTSNPEQRPKAEDDFDSWDTSAVSPQNRQAVLGSIPPASLSSRFLETIPASPTASRSPSPGRPLDLEPPRIRRRSRSYSPSSRSSASTSTLPSVRAPVAAMARTRSYSHTQASEAHIHPLFRSDSPMPPPAFSAGTVVTAAPQAGKVITTDIQSLRTLSRMRSGSLPVVPSPLSRHSSFDDFNGRKAAGISSSSSRCSSSHGVPPDLREEDEDVDGRGRLKAGIRAEERKMTPPIPDWILSAGV